MAEVFREGSREQGGRFWLNRRFTHDMHTLRAGSPVGCRALRRHRLWRSPAFKRVVTIAAAMAQSPDRSLPKQTENWADPLAAYRFLNHPEVTPDQIQQTHRSWTRAQSQRRPLILSVQDTTELDFTGRGAVSGLGPIGNGGGQGLLQHSALAVDPSGQLLGVLHQTWKTRVPVPEGETRSQRLERPRESDFWPETVRAIGSLGADARVIHVTDRGGDLFETMTACGEQPNVGFLIRAQHDRCVEGETPKLWSYLASQPISGHRDVPVPAKDSDPAGVARVAVRFACVSLEAPRKDPRFSEPVTVWAVYAKQEHPTDSEPGIEWILLSSEAVNTFEEACRCLDWYTLRWVIEEWHRAQKTGCRLEASQLQTAEAIQCLASLTAIIAVRLLQLRDLAQVAVKEQSDDASSPANQPEALQAAVPRTWLLIVAKLAKCDPLELTPRQFWLTIAKKGGFLGRKHDGPPGWITIWRGWYDVMLMVQGAELLAATPTRQTYV